MINHDQQFKSQQKQYVKPQKNQINPEELKYKTKQLLNANHRFIQQNLTKFNQQQKKKKYNKIQRNFKSSFINNLSNLIKNIQERELSELQLILQVMNVIGVQMTVLNDLSSDSTVEKIKRSQIIKQYSNLQSIMELNSKQSIERMIQFAQSQKLNLAFMPMASFFNGLKVKLENLYNKLNIEILTNQDNEKIIQNNIPQNIIKQQIGINQNQIYQNNYVSIQRFKLYFHDLRDMEKQVANITQLIQNCIQIAVNDQINDSSKVFYLQSCPNVIKNAQKQLVEIQKKLKQDFQKVNNLNFNKTKSKRLFVGRYKNVWKKLNYMILNNRTLIKSNINVMRKKLKVMKQISQLRVYIPPQLKDSMSQQFQNNNIQQNLSRSFIQQQQQTQQVFSTMAWDNIDSYTYIAFSDVYNFCANVWNTYSNTSLHFATQQFLNNQIGNQINQKGTNAQSYQIVQSQLPYFNFAYYMTPYQFQQFIQAQKVRNEDFQKLNNQEKIKFSEMLLYDNNNIMSQLKNQIQGMKQSFSTFSEQLLLQKNTTKEVIEKFQRKYLNQVSKIDRNLGQFISKLQDYSMITKQNEQAFFNIVKDILNEKLVQNMSLKQSISHLQQISTKLNKTQSDFLVKAAGAFKLSENQIKQIIDFKSKQIVSQLSKKIVDVSDQGFNEMKIQLANFSANINLEMKSNKQKLETQLQRVFKSNDEISRKLDNIKDNMQILKAQFGLQLQKSLRRNDITHIMQVKAKLQILQKDANIFINTMLNNQQKLSQSINQLRNFLEIQSKKMYLSDQKASEMIQRLNQTNIQNKNQIITNIKQISKLTNTGLTNILNQLWKAKGDYGEMINKNIKVISQMINNQSQSNDSLKKTIKSTQNILLKSLKQKIQQGNISMITDIRTNISGFDSTIKIHFNNLYNSMKQQFGDVNSQLSIIDNNLKKIFQNNTQQLKYLQSSLQNIIKSGFIQTANINKQGFNSIYNQIQSNQTQNLNQFSQLNSNLYQVGNQMRGSFNQIGYGLQNMNANNQNNFNQLRSGMQNMNNQNNSNFQMIRNQFGQVNNSINSINNNMSNQFHHLDRSNLTMGYEHEKNAIIHKQQIVKQTTSQYHNLQTTMIQSKYKQQLVMKDLELKLCDNKRLQMDMLSLKQKNIQLTSELKNFKAILSCQTASQVIQKVSQMKKSQFKLIQVEEKLKKFQQKNQNFQKISKSINVKEQEITRLNIILKETRQQLQQGQKDSRKNQNQLKRVKMQIQNTRNQKSDLQSKTKKLQEEKRKLNQQILSTKQTFQKKLNLQEKQKKSLQRKINIMQQQISDFKNQKRQVEQKINQLQKRNNESILKINKTEQKFKKKDDQNSSNLKILNQVQQQLKKTKKIAEDNEKQEKKVKKLLEDKLNQIQKIKKERNEKSNQKSRIQVQMTKLQASNTQNLIQKKKLQQKIQNLEKSIYNLNQQKKRQSLIKSKLDQQNKIKQDTYKTKYQDLLKQIEEKKVQYDKFNQLSSKLNGLSFTKQDQNVYDEMRKKYKNNENISLEQMVNLNRILDLKNLFYFEASNKINQQFKNQFEKLYQNKSQLEYLIQKQLNLKSLELIQSDVKTIQLKDQIVQLNKKTQIIQKQRQELQSVVVKLQEQQKNANKKIQQLQEQIQKKTNQQKFLQGQKQESQKRIQAYQQNRIQYEKLKKKLKLKYQQLKRCSKFDEIQSIRKQIKQINEKLKIKQYLLQIMTSGYRNTQIIDFYLQRQIEEKKSYLNQGQDKYIQKQIEILEKIKSNQYFQYKQINLKGLQGMIEMNKISISELLKKKNQQSDSDQNQDQEQKKSNDDDNDEIRINFQKKIHNLQNLVFQLLKLLSKIVLQITVTHDQMLQFIANIQGFSKDLTGFKKKVCVQLIKVLMDFVNIMKSFRSQVYQDFWRIPDIKQYMQSLQNKKQELRQLMKQITS